MVIAYGLPGSLGGKGIPDGLPGSLGGKGIPDGLSIKSSSDS